MERWTEESLIYDGVVVKLRAGKVALDDGSPAYREVIEHPGGVCVIPFTGHSVIFVRQFRIAVNEYVLEAPAGKREGQDDPEERGRMELEEETGYRAEHMHFAGTHFASVGFCSEVVYVYLATGLEPTSQRLDPEERIEIVELPLDEVRRRLKAHQFTDGKTIIGLHALMDYLAGQECR